MAKPQKKRKKPPIQEPDLLFDEGVLPEWLVDVSKDPVKETAKETVVERFIEDEPTKNVKTFPPLRTVPKSNVESNQKNFTKVVKERKEELNTPVIYTDDLMDQSVTAEKIANRSIDATKIK
ncbi:hypothetical protein ACPW7N_03955, partial [Brevibacillus sp. SYSU BS000544]